MKKINLFVLTAVSAILLAACDGTVAVKQYDGTEVQGVSAEEIIVGNTAATTGGFATVGVPFNAGIEAVFSEYNAAGGYNGADLRLVHYDDEFDGAKGLTFTQKLVEEDKVFALVGHFGTNTVAATVDYIKDQGIPMVYAATGISDLYQEAAEGYNKAVMPVQPIYNFEGRMLLARALADDATSGLSAAKIGVITTTDDAGEGMLYGVRKQAELLTAAEQEKIVYVTTPAEQGTNHSAPVNTLKTAGVDVVIVGANQVPFGEILNYMRDANFNTKVITSYVTANTTTLRAAAVAGSITADRPVYTNSWLDLTDPTTISEANPYGFSNDYYAFATTMVNAGQAAYALDSYAIAGYIAAKVFVQGLERVKANEEDLVWLNYINAMEESTVNLPMGSALDYSDGKRLGVTDLGFSKLFLGATDLNTSALGEVDTLRTIEYVWNLVPAAKKA